MDKKKKTPALKDRLKKFAITTMVIFNIALVGAVAGAILTHQADTSSNAHVQALVQAALKAIPAAQAASPNR